MQMEVAVKSDGLNTQIVAGGMDPLQAQRTTLVLPFGGDHYCQLDVIVPGYLFQLLLIGPHHAGLGEYKNFHRNLSIQWYMGSPSAGWRRGQSDGMSLSGIISQRWGSGKQNQVSRNIDSLPKRW